MGPTRKLAYRIMLTASLIGCAVYLNALQPEWLWAKRAGGNFQSNGSAIAVDEYGNSYVTGTFRRTATFGEIDLESEGETDIFVAKLDSEGNWLWAIRAGGTGRDFATGIAVDIFGNIYLTGYFEGTASFGETEFETDGDRDIFVTKLDREGSWLWAIRAGGTDQSEGHAIAVDKNGNIYVTGNFWGITAFGETELESDGDWDIFIAKLDSEGNWLWAKKSGDTLWAVSRAIAVDKNGNSYVTGHFMRTATFGDIELESEGETDIFVAMMDSDGNWIWAERAGGRVWDESHAIAVDNEGNCYLAGYFNGAASFGETVFQSEGESDIFVAKLNSEGNWIWAKQAGGTEGDYGYAITVDTGGNIYVTGYFSGRATFGEQQLETLGSYELFAAKLDAQGYWFWVQKARGTEIDGNYGFGIAVDNNRNCHLTGWYSRTVMFGEIELQGGPGDIFVSKLADIPTSVDLPHPEPLTRLKQNYPNPFNPETIIEFSVKEETNAKVAIYNQKGQLVRILHSGFVRAGEHRIIWNGKDEQGVDVSSGVYLYRLQTEHNDVVKRMLLVK